MLIWWRRWQEQRKKKRMESDHRLKRERAEALLVASGYCLKHRRVAETSRMIGAHRFIYCVLCTQEDAEKSEQRRLETAKAALAARTFLGWDEGDRGEGLK